MLACICSVKLRDKNRIISAKTTMFSWQWVSHSIHFNVTLSRGTCKHAILIRVSQKYKLWFSTKTLFLFAKCFTLKNLRHQTEDRSGMIARLSREEFIFQVTLFLLQTFSQEKRKKKTTLCYGKKSALGIINKLGHWKTTTFNLSFLHYKRLNWFHE